MIGGSKQNQTSGDNSNNYQAQSIIIQKSDEGEIRSIVDKQIEGRLALLSGEAFNTYKDRCKDFTDGLIMALRSTNDAHVERLREPSVQFSIEAAQRGFGETGNKSIKDTLIKIISKMCAANNNHMDTIYKDAIEAVGKLNTRQLNFITLKTVLYNLSSKALGNYDDYIEYLKSVTDPFIEDLPTKNIEVLYLEHLGLGTYGTDTQTIFARLRKEIGGLFQAGYVPAAIEGIPEAERPGQEHLMECFHDKAKIQIGYMNPKSIRASCEGKIDPRIINKIVELYNMNVMGEIEIADRIIKSYPGLQKACDVMHKFNGDMFRLGAVGQVIAIINLESKTGINIDRSGWE